MIEEQCQFCFLSDGDLFGSLMKCKYFLRSLKAVFFFLFVLSVVMADLTWKKGGKKDQRNTFLCSMTNNDCMWLQVPETL